VTRASAEPVGGRWLRRCLVAVLTVAVLLGAGAGLVLAVTPSASDAEVRTHRLALSRGVPDDGVPVPSTFATALIATEDSRFLDDRGIDLRGVLRAAGEGLGLPGAAGGATLEQQLAKMLYFAGQRTPVDQVEEVALALKLDSAWTKSEILRMYAVTAYFGHGAYGLDTASCGYFGVPPSALDWDRAALLAGLVQAPTDYDPYLHPDLARERQAHVLDRLVATGAITRERADAARVAPWGLRDPAAAVSTRCRS
jgi:membrane peptidoglycan carboxypeptidase